ncbi:MAG: S-layer homology domain-containing protein [Cyanobacteria bacterium]|nr:S-layer homology domain-containing protein [Cyanobacteria bacterium CG_2015-16_32_12]NCO79030.1 S-layer homology domain-containing protein [Cyanobacteria bacterium CG_2015-22_32_23]NCQ04681.1 S-layer homology domain-containing protein [Cyanobacteria bacterium CG_2015-09_32_10]NCQ41565.1 S-layer homology domain-containing protein [Cyanobacteria bacterium CG_2015-04_32_10]NCS85667.1 S-layer homology domain-containing protein [Cyanobacteria bacterium CG_2015-02_32_10]
MNKINKSKTTTALLLTVTLGVSTSLPFATSLFNPVAVMAQNSQFQDVSSNYWAAQFINPLVREGVIAGFPDGTFKPDAPVTRAQFAAMLQKAIRKNQVRSPLKFSDVSTNYWANNAINNAYAMGFLSGYPGQIFRPEQNIPREQVLVSLANGLNYRSNQDVNSILNFYNDANNISNFARLPVAAATENKLVVNHPTLQQLNPVNNATRAEVAAFIYQALVSQGQLQAINSNYIVGLTPTVNKSRLADGTNIPVKYEEQKILLTKDETVPLTLIVASDVANNGVVIIPRNSKIIGELRPSGKGTRFFAQKVQVAKGKTYNISASSQVITKTETISKSTNFNNLLKNAALGTAAAAAISAVTGDKAIATEELLIGTGAGLLATLIPQFLGLNKVDLLVVQPNSNFNVILDKDFVIN